MDITTEQKADALECLDQIDELTTKLKRQLREMEKTTDELRWLQEEIRSDLDG